MRQQFTRTLVICLTSAMCCAGCAKHELVKQDQMIPATAPALAPAPPAKAAVKEGAAPAGKDTGLTQTSIKESQVGGKSPQSSHVDEVTHAALQTALDKVFFDFDSPELSPAGRATLVKNAEVLKRQASLKVRIEGNCDEMGSDDYNLSLGESRAKSAMNYLKSLGIQPERISIISYGKEKPADSGHDEGARAKNRRDEFVTSSK
jgi:peptidoglycan-associated lipoprotein